MKNDNSRSTVLIISMGFLLLFFLFAWRWTLIVSFIIGVLGIFSSFMSQKIEWAWMKLTRMLGFIVPKILLTVVFYLFLLPVSLLSRISKKDPLMLSKKYNTYFLDVNNKTDKNDLRKTW